MESVILSDMNETEFHRLADRTLEALAMALEAADESGAIDAELAGGALTIALDGGRQIIVSKHAASRQIWLSSPVSGGLHFRPGAAGTWLLPDGRVLHTVLADDLAATAHIRVSFT